MKHLIRRKLTTIRKKLIKRPNRFYLIYLFLFALLLGKEVKSKNQTLENQPKAAFFYRDFTKCVIKKENQTIKKKLQYNLQNKKRFQILFLK